MMLFDIPSKPWRFPRTILLTYWNVTPCTFIPTLVGSDSSSREFTVTVSRAVRKRISCIRVLLVFVFSLGHRGGVPRGTAYTYNLLLRAFYARHAEIDFPFSCGRVLRRWAPQISESERSPVIASVYVPPHYQPRSVRFFRKGKRFPLASVIYQRSTAHYFQYCFQTCTYTMLLFLEISSILLKYIYVFYYWIYLYILLFKICIKYIYIFSLIY